MGMESPETADLADDSCHAPNAGGRVSCAIDGPRLSAFAFREVKRRLCGLLPAADPFTAGGTGHDGRMGSRCIVAGPRAGREPAVNLVPDFDRAFRNRRRND